MEQTSISHAIPIRRPYDWSYVLSYLLRHECYGIERIKDDVYYRFVPTQMGFGTISVTHDFGQPFLKIKTSDIPSSEVKRVIERIKNLFDTEHEPNNLPVDLSPLTEGIRVPRSYDPFEVGVSIILCQLVSTSHAKVKLRSLVETFGERIGSNAYGPVYRFPKPVDLIDAPVDSLGITKAKAQTIRDFSKAVVAQDILSRTIMDFSEHVRVLTSIKGVGPWTGALISMRCLGNSDAFPRFDLIIDRAMKENLADESRWTASRAYLTHCLWRDYAGVLSKIKKKKSKSA